MLIPRTLTLTCLFMPWLASAALFPAKTEVKVIDAKGFKKVMDHNVTSVVAFVAPWCGYCQRMAPEYSKAAEALAPMVPLFAVDCDQASNKPLCSEQGVQGFPTVKVYPRGGRSKPQSFDSPERTATNFFHWASRSIPHAVKRLDSVSEISGWTNENAAQPRALLLSSTKDIPLIWKALGNKYKHAISFGILQDKSGKQAVKLGVEDTPTKDSKVLIHPPGSQQFVRYEGPLKYKPLNKYLGSVADGTADFPILREQSEDSPVAPDAPVSTNGDATRSESATSSTVTPISSVSSAHIEEARATEGALDQKEADEAVKATEGSANAKPSSVPEATAAAGPDVEGDSRPDHTRDEL
ncbi:thioredoxin-like protein [Rhodofomes roseus]|uniref:Thioredoxin-like protein n=1 Tax=Rhodofomes roseus TaxID=34475 RepID=A0A4Y9YJ83_9APHY|nr:thioredoxin-like protein [Rhodofomes roseus]KAH9832654.1 thioredoxin-like protein [Rhodofomes roseus]TFY61511.1 hypothetical protein EVJ58_g4480 [Rhodofomes roseus]